MELSLFSVILAFLLAVAITAFLRLFAHRSRPPARSQVPSLIPTDAEPPSSPPQVLVLHASQKGTCKGYAESIYGLLKDVVHADVNSAASFDGDSFVSTFSSERLSSTRQAPPILVFVVATYTDGHAPDAGQLFEAWLADLANDFRVPRNFLSTIRFAVFGCGHSSYGTQFNAFARTVDTQMRALGARRVHPVGLGDQDSGRLSEQSQVNSTIFARTVLIF
jgi:sulfite reductase alpha subunit-like flavoprotein